jgi:hypothetical protein
MCVILRDGRRPKRAIRFDQWRQKYWAEAAKSVKPTSPPCRSARLSRHRMIFMIFHSRARGIMLRRGHAERAQWHQFIRPLRGAKSATIFSRWPLQLPEPASLLASAQHRFGHFLKTAGSNQCASRASVGRSSLTTA